MVDFPRLCKFISMGLSCFFLSADFAEAKTMIRAVAASTPKDFTCQFSFEEKTAAKKKMIEMMFTASKLQAHKFTLHPRKLTVRPWTIVFQASIFRCELLVSGTLTFYNHDLFIFDVRFYVICSGRSLPGGVVEVTCWHKISSEPRGSGRYCGYLVLLITKGYRWSHPSRRIVSNKSYPLCLVRSWWIFFRYQLK